jgi:hypothetical protein
VRLSLGGHAALPIRRVGRLPFSEADGRTDHLFGIWLRSAAHSDRRRGGWFQLSVASRDRAVWVGPGR